jgi:hypothetical protein
MYSLPAAIGTVVKAEVQYSKYSNHVFKRIGAVELESDGENAAEKFVVETDSTFQNMHYQDTTTRPLKVSVVMGLCDLFLGQAEVVVRHATCEPWRSSLQIGHDTDTTFDYFDVPAHDLMVGFTGVEDEGDLMDDVYDYFAKIYGQGAYQEIDLRILPSEEEKKYEDAADNTAHEAEANTGRDPPQDVEDEPVDAEVTFRFHPRPVAHVQFMGGSSTDVMAYDCTEEAGRDPGLTIKAHTTVDATVFVVELFSLKNEELLCTQVEAPIYLVNLLGNSVEWAVEELANPHSTVTNEEIEMMSKCANKTSPCRFHLSRFQKPEKAVILGESTNMSSYLLNRNGEACVDQNDSTTCATHPSDDPWMMIDLGSKQHIDKLVVHACKNGASNIACIHENLHAFEIWLLETNSVTFEKNGKRCYSNAGNNKDEEETESHEGEMTNEKTSDSQTTEDLLEADCAGESQYILIRRPGQNVQLEMSEVEVWTKQPHELGSQHHMQLTVTDPEPQSGAVDGLNPHTKLFQVLVPVQGYTVTDLQRKTVVIGDKVMEKKGSVSLPDYYPMTVVHDPPGGHSYASYTNIDIGMNVQMTTRDEDLDMKLKPMLGVGVDADLLNCGVVQCSPFFKMEFMYEHS